MPIDRQVQREFDVTRKILSRFWNMGKPAPVWASWLVFSINNAHCEDTWSPEQRKQVELARAAALVFGLENS